MILAIESIDKGILTDCWSWKSENCKEPHTLRNYEYNVSMYNYVDDLHYEYVMTEEAVEEMKKMSYLHGLKYHFIRSELLDGYIEGVLFTGTWVDKRVCL